MESCFHTVAKGRARWWNEQKTHRRLGSEDWIPNRGLKMCEIRILDCGCGQAIYIHHRPRLQWDVLFPIAAGSSASFRKCLHLLVGATPRCSCRADPTAHQRPCCEIWWCMHQSAHSRIHAGMWAGEVPWQDSVSRPCSNFITWLC